MSIENYKKYEPLFGNWHIKGTLGSGSYGTVYEIERHDFGVTYRAALKAITIPQSQSEVESIRAEGMDEKSVTAYFRQMVEEVVGEVALMSKLKGNSNIVSYEDHMVIQHEDQVGWDILIRMELLQPLIKHVRSISITQNEVIKLGIHICKALELCQKHNIIHRDIKPENIFISGSGDYKLGDFGISRTIEKTTGALSQRGTFTYIAPEVFNGKPYGSSVDIYSLGIVMYWLLNGNRTPFMPSYPQPITPRDREMAFIRRIGGEAIPPPAMADVRLCEIVLKMCAHDRAGRYDSLALLRADLEGILHANAEPVKALTHAGAAVGVEEMERTVVGYGGEKTSSIWSLSDNLGVGDELGEGEPVDAQHEETETPHEVAGGEPVAFAHYEPPAYEEDEANWISIKIKRPLWVKIGYIVAILAVFVLGVLGTLFIFDIIDNNPRRVTSGLPAGMVRVPSVINIDVAQAEELLNIINLSLIIVRWDYSDLVPPGVVLTQHINSGSVVSANTVIEVTVSSGAYYDEGVAYIVIRGVEYSTSLTELSLFDMGLTNEDIIPLRHMKNLTTLNMTHNQISDLTPLSNLSSLTVLFVAENQISDLSPLLSHTYLTVLSLGWNQISDLTLLTGFTNLTHLYLASNYISDITPLANLTNLTSLSLGFNQIYDLTPLSSIVNLTELLVSVNQIADLTPLANLANLEVLLLSANQISDISPLSSLTNLTELHLSDNSMISDLAPLSNLTNLESVWLNGLPLVDDWSPVAHVPNVHPPLSPPQAPAPVIHIVQSGDVMSRITFQHFGSSAQRYQDLIIIANDNLNPNEIYVGQRLIIPVLD